MTKLTEMRWQTGVPLADGKYLLQPDGDRLRVFESIPGEHGEEPEYMERKVDPVILDMVQRGLAMDYLLALLDIAGGELVDLRQRVPQRTDEIFGDPFYVWTWFSSTEHRFVATNRGHQEMTRFTLEGDTMDEVLDKLKAILNQPITKGAIQIIIAATTETRLPEVKGDKFVGEYAALAVFLDRNVVLLPEGEHVE